MKKTIYILICISIVFMTLTGCRSNQSLEDASVNPTVESELDTLLQNEQFGEKQIQKTLEKPINEVSDEHFIPMVNDAYEHPEDYSGLCYRIRGHYRFRVIDGVKHHYLFQGKDERWVGFEIEIAENSLKESDIILAVGTFKAQPIDKETLIPVFVIESYTKIEKKSTTW